MKAMATDSEEPQDEEAGRGRPSSYKPEYAAQAEKLCLLGATDDDLADFFGVSDRTITRWAIVYEDFCRSIKIGKAASDDRVERSLFRRATGYTYDAVKIFMPGGAQEPVYAPYREHVPPDTGAMIFWLKNRRRGEWRDKPDEQGSDNTLTIRVIGGLPDGEKSD